LFEPEVLHLQISESWIVSQNVLEIWHSFAVCYWNECTVMKLLFLCALHL